MAPHSAQSSSFVFGVTVQISWSGWFGTACTQHHARWVPEPRRNGAVRSGGKSKPCSCQLTSSLIPSLAHYPPSTQLMLNPSPVPSTPSTHRTITIPSILPYPPLPPLTRAPPCPIAACGSRGTRSPRQQPAAAQTARQRRPDRRGCGTGASPSRSA